MIIFVSRLCGKLPERTEGRVRAHPGVDALCSRGCCLPQGIWQALDDLKAHTRTGSAAVTSSSKCMAAAAELLPSPGGGDTASCLTRAGCGAAAAGWHKRRAWGYEGMVAWSQVPGSWATASSSARPC